MMMFILYLPFSRMFSWYFILFYFNVEFLPDLYKMPPHTTKAYDDWREDDLDGRF